MSDTVSQLQILIDIRARLDELTKSQQGLAATRKEAEGLGALLRQGLGIGTGMELARRSINFLTGSISELVRGTISLATATKDGAEALGMSTDAYQVVQIEMAKAGVEMTRFGMAVAQQTNSLATARDLSSSAAEAYRDLGLSVAQLEQMTPEQRVIAVARATLDAADKTRAFQAAGEILGSRGLPQLLSGLKSLATDGFDVVAKAAKNAGQVMSEDLIEKVDKAAKDFEAARRRLFVGGMSLAQGAMNYFGETLGNSINLMQGLDISSGAGATGAPKKETIKAPTAPALARADEVLTARLAVNAQRAALVNSGLLSEAEQRQLLTSILKEQIALYEKLGEARFGKNWEEQRSALLGKLEGGQITDPELKTLQAMNELEGKLRESRIDRMKNVETPMDKLASDLLDTTTLMNATLAGTTSQAISSLSSDIWSAMQGTANWSDSFRNLGAIAGRALTELLVKLYIIQPILTALGFGGVSTGTPGTPAVVGIAPGNVKSAGGGSFLTRGPTQFTVGDNPGGIELVSVLPLSGIGRTTINGRALAMAGGGSALVAGAGAGASIVINQTLNIATGVAATVRAEILAAAPQLRSLAVDAVQEAQIRNRLRL